jgi:hypothetical protein
MSIAKIVGVWILAISTATLWLTAAEMVRTPRLLSELATMAYPASIILGAGALAITVVRLRVCTTRRGNVSLGVTGLVVLAGLGAVFAEYNRGGTLVHNLCWYVSISFVLAYVFLVLLRSSASPR